MRGKDREWQKLVEDRLSEWNDGLFKLRSDVSRLARAMEEVASRHNKIDYEARMREMKDKRRQELAEAGLKPKAVEAAMRVFYGEAGDGR